MGVIGARVFIDENANGTPDANEADGVYTGERGGFSYSGALSGAFIGVGGVNSDTHLPNTLALYAPEYSTVLNSITTALYHLILNHGINSDEAQTALISAFELPEGIELTNETQNEADVISVSKLNAKLEVLASNSNVDLFWDNLSSAVVDANDPIDLSDSQTLNAILVNSNQPVDQLAAAIQQIESRDTLLQIAAAQRDGVITVSHKVAGLYAAFFNRAPDASGLSYWEDYVYVEGLSLDRLAELFATHEIFTETYGHLSNREFVEAIYENMLGGTGDQTGIDYWEGLLNNGMTRAKMISDFVQGSLVIDLDSMLAAGSLTYQEYEDAIGRQSYITNKAMVGVEFSESIGELSNATSSGLELLNDPAYQASIAALHNVDNSSRSFFDALQVLQDASSPGSDSLDYIIESSGLSFGSSTPDADEQELEPPLGELVIEDGFTTEWLDGKLLYNVYRNLEYNPETGLDEWDDEFGVASLLFTDSTFSIDEGITSNPDLWSYDYTVNEGGYITFYDDFPGDEPEQKFIALHGEFTDPGDYLRITWTGHEEPHGSDHYISSQEYFFFDAASVDLFISG